MSFLTKLTFPCFLIALLSGCGDPVTSVVKIGIHVVGKVVDDAETKKIGDQLLGRKPSQADAVLGQNLDIYSDVNSSRQWRVYPVPMDVLNNQRYVVEAADDRIVLVEMVKEDSNQLDIPLEMIYHEKLKGKTPAECETELHMGPPILTLRSRKTGLMCQFYDARLIKELPSPHYCIVRFDGTGRCEKVKFAEVAATDAG